MCSHSVPLRHGLALLLGLAAAATAHGQQIVTASLRQDKAQQRRDSGSTDGSVHRITILEGANSRVQYVTTGNISSSDRQSLYNLERAENELAYLRDLQQLKLEYVKTERLLEPHRRAVQMELYGREIVTSNYSSSYVNYSPNRTYGYPGGLYGYNTGGYWPYYSFSPYSYGGYGYGGGALGYRGSSGYTERRSLQYGMGDEGRMKNAIIQTIATPSSSDNVNAAIKNYETAVDRAAESPVLSRDLGLKKRATPPPKP